MKCRVRCQILFGLVALLQFGCVSGKWPEKDHALTLQTKVENLIEKILKVIQDYYHQIKTELKCIPDDIPDTIIGTLKNAIDCVDQNERNYECGRITANVHKKVFLKCFSDAKSNVEETITSIDPNLDYCPKNMTEKTYQINVTTSFTKTFHINIKNGLEIMKKKVHLGNEEKIYVFNQGEQLSGNINETAQGNETTNDFSDEDSSSADENEVTDLHSKGHHGTGHEPKEILTEGHESKEHHGKGHEPKENHGKEQESKEHHGTGHEPKEILTEGHESKEHHGKGHEPKENHGKEQESKEHHGTGHEPKEILTEGHESKEHHGTGHEPKEILTEGHESKEHHGKGHETKENHGKEQESKEHHGTGHEPKEILTEGHESKEHHGTGHEPKEILTEGHESKEHHGKGHESKEILTEGHESKEHHGKGHETKENHGKEQESKENPLGISESGVKPGGNEDGVSYEPGREIVGDYDNDSDFDDYSPLKERPGYSGASNDDDDDENENEFSNAGEYDEESDEDEKGGLNRPDLAQVQDEESETERYHIARPDSKEFHGKGHESKVIYGKDFNSAQQPGDHEESQGYDGYKSYEDYDADDADDDVDDDEDSIFLQEGKQDTTVKTKFTTRPPGKLAMESPTKKPFDQDYYADPDMEPEDSSYGNEYYDASEKEKNLTEHPEKSFNQKLGQSKPAALVAQRIQIKPKNQYKQKVKKPPQSSQRHKITLPKTLTKKAQPRRPSQSITSLSQSFLQSDF